MKVFEKIIVEYSEICIYPEYKGKPYFSIQYEENGEHFIGYGTYNPEVLSRYIKEYFITSTIPSNGKWIKKETTIDSLCYPIRECSRCGYEYSMTVNFRYCPNCGDKKEEEEKDVSRSYELDHSRTCRDCKYAGRLVNLEPCFSCSSKIIHTSWEPKEEKNESNDTLS